MSMESLKNKKAATEEIQKSVRDLLTLKITLPIGNLSLKNVHTNQFLWLDLGNKNEFEIANMEALSKALNSTSSRWSGYEKNRYYIEGVTIRNDGSSCTMDLDLNPFASSITKYRDEYQGFLKAYTDATKSQTTNKTTTTTTTNNVKGGEGKTIDDLVRKIVGNETDDLKKCKLIHGWLQSNVRYSSYSCTRYSSPESCLNHKGGLNCVDTARLTRAMMSSAGLNAYVVHRTYNGGHFWTVIEIGGKKYASDQTGSGSEFNTVWKASGRTGNGGYADYSHRDGKNPCC